MFESLKHGQMERFDSYMTSINELCRKHRVKSLYAFGSVLTERFSSKSDIDLIVAFEKLPVEEYIDNYYDLKFSLEDILMRPVDLLEEQAIKNPYFRQHVNQQKQLLYGNIIWGIVINYLPILKSEIKTLLKE